MRDAFRRSEKFLDLEKGIEHATEEQKETSTEKLGNLSKEELALLQNLLAKMNNSKISASS